MNRLELCQWAKSILPDANVQCPYFRMVEEKYDLGTVGDILKSGLVFLEDGRLASPYETFWIERPMMTVYFDVSAKELRYWAFQIIGGRRLVYDFTFTGIDQLAIESPDDLARFHCSAGLNVDGQQCDFSQTQLKEITDIAQGIAILAACFCFLVNHPNNVIMQSCPREHRHDTQWKLSRSHWHIVPRQYGQALKMNRSATFEEIRSLSAHYRRAHFRQYRADRFRNVKGQRRWVRKCWVGPREFEGSDQKVYYVVSPTVDRA